MLGIGMPELVIILVIVMLIFGAGRLPEMGKSLGQAIRGFRKAVEEPEKVGKQDSAEQQIEKAQK